MNKTFAFALMLILLGVSCKKKTVDTNQFYISEFPIELGNRWTYSYTDWSGWSDTAIITVASFQRLQDGNIKYLCPVMLAHEVADTVVFVKSPQGLYFSGTYNHLQHFFGESSIPFPICSGKEWTFINKEDRLKVEDVSDSTVNRNFVFKDTYYISRHFSSDSMYINSSCQINKNIGFTSVSINENFSASIPNRMHLELLDFEIK